MAIIKPFLEDKVFPGTRFIESGKVRDLYITDDDYFIVVASDRTSAFDHILPIILQGKGIILNEITKTFFEKIGNRVPHAFVGQPHPRALVYKLCKPIPVELVLRGYLCGSMWRDYKAGQRVFWGINLPDGMREYDQLPEVMITPTTKAKQGHDESISEQEIISSGLCSAENWEKLKEYGLKLFSIGTDSAKEMGLILLDTKYEFGLDKEGNPLLIDEVHTPDSSRYIYRNGYEDNLLAGLSQKELSKEHLRKYLISKGAKSGMSYEELPEIPGSVIDETHEIYQEILKELTGKDFFEIYKRKEDNAETVIMKTARFLGGKREPKVGIIMGSSSDLVVMREAADVLDSLCIGYRVDVVSAHRTPEKLEQFAKQAVADRMEVIVAGAGGAAHLPGMVQSYTTLPVIGVPIKSSNSLDGWDSLLSIVQMPPGVPVATMAVNGSKNAGIFAAQIVGLSNAAVAKKLKLHKATMKQNVSVMSEQIAQEFPR